MAAKSEMKIIRSIFCWVGMAPSLLHIRSKSPVYNVFIFLASSIQLIFLTIELYKMLQHLEKYGGQLSPIILLTDLIHFVVVFFAGFVQILENFLKCSCDQRIENSHGRNRCKCICKAFMPSSTELFILFKTKHQATFDCARTLLRSGIFLDRFCNLSYNYG